MTAAIPQRILLTGAAGVVGRAACKALVQRGHHVRAFDRVPTPPELNPAESIAGDIADPQAVLRAAESMDVILHLAANAEAGEPDFIRGLVPSNIVGVHNVCEAAREHKAKRLVLTSSVMVVWALPWRQRMIHMDDGFAPVGHYALSKVFAEEMGRMYARVHGLSVVAMRLGWLPRQQSHIDTIKSDPRNACLYMSAADAGRAYVCAAEASAAQVGGYAAIFIRSRCDLLHGIDIEPAKRVIGFEPQDGFFENLPEDLQRKI